MRTLFVLKMVALALGITFLSRYSAFLEKKGFKLHSTHTHTKNNQRSVSDRSVSELVHIFRSSCDGISKLIAVTHYLYLLRYKRGMTPDKPFRLFVTGYYNKNSIGYYVSAREIF